MTPIPINYGAEITIHDTDSDVDRQYGDGDFQSHVFLSAVDDQPMCTIASSFLGFSISTLVENLRGHILFPIRYPATEWFSRLLSFYSGDT